MGGCKSGTASLFTTKAAPVGEMLRCKPAGTKIRRVDVVRRKRKHTNLSFPVPEERKEKKNAALGDKMMQGSEVQVGRGRLGED